VTRCERAARARAWRNAAHAAICDVIEPWEHGTIVRSTRFPTYYDYNLVRVEDAAPIGVDTLTAVADRALAPLRHRRVSFDHVAAAEPLRAPLNAAGWRAARLLWMRYEAPLPLASRMGVTPVCYEDVHPLRLAWRDEEAPARDPDAPGDITAFHRDAHEVALTRDALVLAVHDEAGRPVGFAQLERAGGAAEISQLFVLGAQRGAGRGAALVGAAIRAAGAVRDLWICADDEARAKTLYARLGFRPAWTMMEFELVR